jgi:UDP-N-acetyl-D-galactosamine dehydrogenase
MTIIQRKISVVGLGYVGLPVAVAFGKLGHVVAFDISKRRVDELFSGIDATREITPEELKAADLYLTTDANDLKAADFHIVTVPTPIDEAKRPDLTPLISASTTVGGQLKRGDIVVYESTVYPGATEEVCVPILERMSGLKAGTDFNVGYSPERINPGDHIHRLATITKVVSGDTPQSTRIIADTYAKIITAGIYEAENIKTAEAAKVIENIQRDINIALMNELSTILDLMDIDTNAVLKAAGTKWNFLKFTPGLVGGHCIGVDPYYLTHKAQMLGHHPEVILAGRSTNNAVGARVARQAVRMVMAQPDATPFVTILGFTFKEDVPDIRNSRVVDIVKELKSYGAGVQIHDPMAYNAEVEHEYGLSLTNEKDLQPSSCVILAVPHATYRNAGWAWIKGRLKMGKGAVLDVKAVLDRALKPDGITLWRL